MFVVILIESRVGFWRAVRDKALGEHFDSVLFYNTTIDSIACMRALKRKGIIVIYELCDLLSTIQTRFPTRIFYRICETLLPRSSSLNLTISTSLAKFLHSVSPGIPVEVIPGLFDFSKFVVNEASSQCFRKKLGLENSQLLFTYSGTWLKIKGISTMLEAWRIFQANSPSSRLCITGGYQPRTNCLNAQLIANRMGLTDSVIFT